jgi:hypothetical protein
MFAGRKPLLLGLAALCMFVSAASFGACGGVGDKGAGSRDGGGDSTTASSGSSGSSSGVVNIGDSGNPFGGDGGCASLGNPCNANGACCSGTCNSGACGYPACTPDNGACTGNSQCCSGTCTAGACATLNTGCKTLGNACAGGGDCCSGLCSGGTCQPSSFCAQQGDACHTGTDCCGGLCNVASGQTLGTCGPPPSGSANCKMPDGVLCAGAAGDGGVTYDDAGLPSCGGGCCSRACAPWGPTGVLVCQPATGCHVTGDLCTKDTDCCGAMGVPSVPSKNGKYVTCEITAPNTVGICSLKSRSCEPNGGACRLATNSCNQTCDCCAGNCHDGTCKQDNDGVPRCTNAQCADAGVGCASSADCCNGAPCVPNPGGNPPYVCYTSQCVACGGPCTVSSDCCPGVSCQVANGSAQGTCGPCGSGSSSGGSSSSSGSGSSSGGSSSGSGSSGGPDAGCSLYGQLCTTAAQCCNGVPCTLGRCYSPTQ